MRIAIFSLAPIFPKQVHGGSQKILRQVAIHLGTVGHDVRIVCVSRPDNNIGFNLHENVHVDPCLKLKPTYPEPYYTAPYNLTSMISIIKNLVDWCDVFYVHDAEMPFHDLYSSKPTVFSFRDFVYPDTLVGAFGFRRDRLILNSSYLVGCVIDAFSTLMPSMNERIHQINNGIDLQQYRPLPGAPGSELCELLGELPEATYTIIHPHRPDSRKGIFETLKVLAKVKRKLARKGYSIRLLLPVWMDSEVAPNSEHEYQTIYNEIKNYAKELDVDSSVFLHPWIPQHLMPEYYSSADVTMCLGNFVEAFGNAHFESIASGTPVLAANVGAHASILPSNMVNRIPFSDTQYASDCLEYILLNDKGLDSKEAREVLHKEFNYQEMLSRYEHILTTTCVSDPLSVQNSHRII